MSNKNKNPIPYGLGMILSIIFVMSFIFIIMPLVFSFFSNWFFAFFALVILTPLFPAISEIFQTSKKPSLTIFIKEYLNSCLMLTTELGVLAFSIIPIITQLVAILNGLFLFAMLAIFAFFGIQYLGLEFGRTITQTDILNTMPWIWKSFLLELLVIPMTIIGHKLLDKIMDFAVKKSSILHNIINNYFK